MAQRARLAAILLLSNDWNDLHTTDYVSHRKDCCYIHIAAGSRKNVRYTLRDGVLMLHRMCSKRVDQEDGSR